MLLLRQKNKKHLNKLSVRAMQYITVLKEAGIPSQYWTEDAMNWVLIRWSHRQNMDYRVLFNRYEKHLNQDLSNSERHKLHVHGKQFHNNLKKSAQLRSIGAAGSPAVRLHSLLSHLRMSCQNSRYTTDPQYPALSAL